MAAVPKMSVSISVSDPSTGCPPVCGAAAGSGAALAEADGEAVAVPVGAVVGEGVGDGDSVGDGDGVSVGIVPAATSRPLEPRATVITAATSIKMRLAVNVFAMYSSFRIRNAATCLNAANPSTVNVGATYPDAKEPFCGTGFGQGSPNKIAEGPPSAV